MSLLVYLPGYTGTDRRELVARGLGELLEPGIDIIPTNIRNGPDDCSGLLVTFLPPGDSPREVNRETQTWLEAPPDGDLGKGRYWIGFANDRKPSAGELQRRDLIDGEPVLLGDGNQWIIPVCEYAPRRLTRDRETGAELRVVKDAHKQWVEWSNEIFKTIASDDYAALVKSGYAIRIPRGMEYAALTLSKNYRVNLDAVDLLALLDEEQISELILAATGTLLRARLLGQKKSGE